MCQDTNLLNPVHGIVQSVVYHEESPPQYQPSYLQSNRSHFLYTPNLWTSPGDTTDTICFPPFSLQVLALMVFGDLLDPSQRCELYFPAFKLPHIYNFEFSENTRLRFRPSCQMTWKISQNLKYSCLHQQNWKQCNFGGGVRFLFFFLFLF